jgi:hypothetical protein
MPEPTRFQQMNGCSACVHAKETDPQGQPAGAAGSGVNFWCLKLATAVATRQGSACEHWEYQS